MSKFNLALLVALVPAVAFIIWLAGSSGLFPFERDFSGQRVVRIGNVPIQADVADTEAARARGLSGRSALGANEGLLFIFDEVGSHGIWMKDMQFPIDIIWIAPTSNTSSSGGNEILRVVDIEEDARPDSFPHVFFPNQNALYVLEVNANFVEIHGIRVGDVVRFAR